MRTEKRKKQKIRRANFPELKYLEELDVKELPKDAQVALNELETLEFIREGRNVVLYGNPGTGKTHLATALAIRACEEDMTVLFTTVPRLLTQIRECRSQKKLTQLERNFEKYDLVICDEFGYVSCDKEGGELLFNHLSLRAGKKSTIITTNLAFNRWNEIIKDKVLVAAMVDRLTHKAFIINMTGDSYRLKETKKSWLICKIRNNKLLL
jgi:DNA replication protein DnaC